MAQKTEQLVSMATKKGVMYYVHADAEGRLSTTTDIKKANVSDLQQYAKEDGHTPRMIQSGGICLITYRTQEELKQRRDERRAERKLFINSVKEREYRRLLNHPPAEFKKAFLEKHRLSEKAIMARAKKKAKYDALSKKYAKMSESI